MPNYRQKNAIRSENILNQSNVRVYTDGSKLNGRVGTGLRVPTIFQKKKNSDFFHTKILHNSKTCKPSCPKFKTTPMLPSISNRLLL